MPVHREDCGCLVHRGNCGRCMGSKCLVLPPQAPALMLTAALTLMASPHPHRFQGLCFLLPYHPAPLAGLLDIGPSANVASHPLGVKNTAPAQGSGHSTLSTMVPALHCPYPQQARGPGLIPFSILTAIPGGQAPASSPPEGQSGPHSAEQTLCSQRCSGQCSWPARY